VESHANDEMTKPKKMTPEALGRRRVAFYHAIARDT
jgi:hypothetical protein